MEAISPGRGLRFPSEIVFPPKNNEKEGKDEKAIARQRGLERAGRATYVERRQVKGLRGECEVSTGLVVQTEVERGGILHGQSTRSLRCRNLCYREGCPLPGLKTSNEWEFAVPTGSQAVTLRTQSDTSTEATPTLPPDFEPSEERRTSSVGLEAGSLRGKTESHFDQKRGENKLSGSPDRNSVREGR